MINPLGRDLASIAAARPQSRSIRSAANSFRDQVNSAVPSFSRPSMTAFSGRGANSSATPASAINLSVPRRNDVATTASAISTPSPAPIAPALQASDFPTISGGAGQDTLNAMSALSKALQDAGIDPSSLNMTGHDDIATYPGGAYLNRLITLKAGNHVENFMSDLVNINPSVAVTEIKNLLRMA